MSFSVLLSNADTPDNASRPAITSITWFLSSLLKPDNADFICLIPSSKLPFTIAFLAPNRLYFFIIANCSSVGLFILAIKFLSAVPALAPLTP